MCHHITTETTAKSAKENTNTDIEKSLRKIIVRERTGTVKGTEKSKRAIRGLCFIGSVTGLRQVLSKVCII